jgi:hypothetical protein
LCKPKRIASFLCPSGVAVDSGGVSKQCQWNARPIVVDGAGCQGSFTLAVNSQTGRCWNANIDPFKVSVEMLLAVSDAQLFLGAGQATDKAFEICLL